MCQSQRKAYWKHAVMCCSTTVNNLLWNLHSVTFCFTTFKPVMTFKVLALVVEQVFALLLNFILQTDAATPVTHVKHAACWTVPVMQHGTGGLCLCTLVVHLEHSVASAGMQNKSHIPDHCSDVNADFHRAAAPGTPEPHAVTKLRSQQVSCTGETTSCSSASTCLV